MSLLVTNYFKSQLTSLRYPADEIQYSLNYCQGDGMRFTGQLYAEDIIGVADRLTNGTKKAAIKRAVDKGASIEIKSNDHQYVHYNTMYVVCDDYVCEDLTDFESQSLHEFVELVEEDIKTANKIIDQEVNLNKRNLKSSTGKAPNKKAKELKKKFKPTKKLRSIKK